MPSANQTNTKLDKATLERIKALRGPGETVNQCLHRLIPIIEAAGKRQLRKLYRRAMRKNPQAAPDD